MTETLAPRIKPVKVSEVTILHAQAGRCRLRVIGLRANMPLHAQLEQQLRNSLHIGNFRFNLSCESVTIEHDGTTQNVIRLLRRPPLALPDKPSMTVVPASSLQGNKRRPLTSLAWAGLSLVLAPTLGTPLAMLSLLVAGSPIWHRALKTLVNEQRLNVDFLDGLALAIAVLRQQPVTGAVMALMVHFGDVVRELTAGQSRGKVMQLLDFQTVQARRVDEDGSITLVPATSLQASHMALVLSGDLVPADGKVCRGTAAVDQRHITGEFAPATRQIGDKVYAGSSVVEGAITVLVTDVGPDTVVSKIVDLIEAAPIGETRIQNYAEKFADRLVAPLLGVNTVLLAATGNVDRFMSLAIVDYGTGIRVAAPTSILASMTRAAREGILIKSGSHVEQLATLRGIAFDKTGTLTNGRMAVLEIRPTCTGIDADRILQLAAAAENQLRHPVARALVHHALHVRGLKLPRCTNVQFRIGMGVAADAAGHRIQVGSERYMRQLGIATGHVKHFLAQCEREGHIALLVALDDSLIGVISCSDTPRSEASAVVAGLRSRGVQNIVMLTGDRHGVARRIADAVGIEKIYSEVLPHEKAEIVHRLRAAQGPFAMVGDGVNDSPALAQADVGISLGEGADIARAAADVILLEDGLHQLLPAIDISREALALVRQNYAFMATANTVALALALPAGWMSPVACTLISNGSALLATLNATRPLFSRKHGKTSTDVVHALH